MPSAHPLETLAGPLDVKFRVGAFSSWSSSFVRLQGRWLCVYKRKDDAVRQGAVELGRGVRVTDLLHPDACAKFPRRFDVMCAGGLLAKTELTFRTKTRHERDQWVQAIACNVQSLTSPRGQAAGFGVPEGVPQLCRALPRHPIRIHSDLIVQCATGESIVTCILTQGLAPDRARATAFGQSLVTMNVLHHVMWDRDFTDSTEPFVIVSLEDDDDGGDRLVDHEDANDVAHFMSYLDSRRFWKYIGPSEGTVVPSSTTDSSASSNSRRPLIQLTPSDDDSTAPERGKSVLVAPRDDMTRSSVKASTTTGTTASGTCKTGGKPRQCAVCTKSFNPLRRRHQCRQCHASICSHCCIVVPKQISGVETLVGAPPSTRLCISCKLLNAGSLGQAHKVRDDAVPSSQSGVHDDCSHGRGTTLRRNSSSLALAASFCSHCRNETCSPLTEYSRIAYPVQPSSIHTGFVVAQRLDNEVERLRSVHTLLATMASTPSASRVLCQFSNMAAIASHCPIVVIGFLDQDTYVVESQYGVNLGVTMPRQESFAAHTCRSGACLTCADLAQDIRFVGNPWRQDAFQNAAFYAGIPLTLSNGHIVGALEVFDAQPRFECGHVLRQLETVVRGLVHLLEDILAAAHAAHREKTQAQVHHAQEQAVMEAQLLALLSQTTSTQEQIRTQQTHMVSAIHTHSKQIDHLAKQIERIEGTLAAKLQQGKREEHGADNHVDEQDQGT
ncbi:hypothetical protein PsorP6_001744 [Peronosclerospora sorghi]|uniref:Uncharacterized protein n=1 Tax=Peronosclerospora sorghi TaxID=230839 RepID=A0ACC0WXU6_9STRA|nr:hypothetical protein PsorP6_001744 [Peronosclerospora sorghi]